MTPYVALMLEPGAIQEQESGDYSVICTARHEGTLYEIRKIHVPEGGYWVGRNTYMVSESTLQYDFCDRDSAENYMHSRWHYETPGTPNKRVLMWGREHTAQCETLVEEHGAYCYELLRGRALIHFVAIE